MELNFQNTIIMVSAMVGRLNRSVRSLTMNPRLQERLTITVPHSKINMCAIYIMCELHPYKYKYNTETEHFKVRDELRSLLTEEDFNTLHYYIRQTAIITAELNVEFFVNHLDGIVNNLKLTNSVSSGEINSSLMAMYNHHRQCRAFLTVTELSKLSRAKEYILSIKVSPQEVAEENPISDDEEDDNNEPLPLADDDEEQFTDNEAELIVDDEAEPIAEDQAVPNVDKAGPNDNENL